MVTENVVAAKETAFSWQHPYWTTDRSSRNGSVSRQVICVLRLQQSTMQRLHHHHNQHVVAQTLSLSQISTTLGHTKPCSRNEERSLDTFASFDLRCRFLPGYGHETRYGKVERRPSLSLIAIANWKMQILVHDRAFAFVVFSPCETELKHFIKLR